MVKSSQLAVQPSRVWIHWYWQPSR